MVEGIVYMNPAELQSIQIDLISCLLKPYGIELNLFT